jgi:hypothetical protein
VALPATTATDAATAYRNRWQRGHRYDDRFANGSRLIGVPQRSHGSPARP